MIDDKENTRREIELLKQEVVKDLEAFRGEFQGMADGLAAAKTATQESNAKLGESYLPLRETKYLEFCLGWTVAEGVERGDLSMKVGREGNTTAAEGRNPPIAAE